MYGWAIGQSYPTRVGPGLTSWQAQISLLLHTHCSLRLSWIRIMHCCCRRSSDLHLFGSERNPLSFLPHYRVLVQQTSSLTDVGRRRWQRRRSRHCLSLLKVLPLRRRRRQASRSWVRPAWTSGSTVMGQHQWRIVPWHYLLCFLFFFWSNLLCASNKTHVTHYGFVRNNIRAWAGLGSENVESKTMKDATHPWRLRSKLGGGGRGPQWQLSSTSGKTSPARRRYVRYGRLAGGFASSIVIDSSLVSDPPGFVMDVHGKCRINKNT